MYIAATVLVVFVLALVVVPSVTGRAVGPQKYRCCNDTSTLNGKYYMRKDGKCDQSWVNTAWSCKGISCKDWCIKKKYDTGKKSADGLTCVCERGCKDTDGGENFYKKGSVTNSSGKFADTCGGNNNEYVNEMACDPMQGGTYFCTSENKTCKKGACI